MTTSRIVVKHHEKIIGSVHTLGMSMEAGRMRQIHTPSLIAPILYFPDPAARPNPTEMHAMILPGMQMPHGRGGMRLNIEVVPTKYGVIGGAMRPAAQHH